MSTSRLLLSMLVIPIFAAGCGDKDSTKADDGKATAATKDPEAAKTSADGGEKPVAAVETGGDVETTCTLTPGTLPTVPASFSDQTSVDIFAWQTFGAIAGQWGDWFTTTDMVCAGKDERHIPSACADLSSANPNTRVLSQISKVNDSFIEATVGGLSGNPVIDQNGNFLWYEIFPYYPNTYNWLFEAGLNAKVDAAVNFPVAAPGAPSMTVKLAWMDAGECGGAAPTDAYSEDLLLLYPADANSTGSATCACRKMKLVGTHIAQKTSNQNAWIWATFEHQNNAPDCQSAATNVPAPTFPNPGKGTDSPGPNTKCPQNVSQISREYFLYGNCMACTTECNTPPAQDPSLDTCEDGWCADVPRNPSSGTPGTVSKLCRQFSASDYYGAGVTSWDDTPGNKACKPTSGFLSNYQLISTQWITPETSGDNNVAADFAGTGSGTNGETVLPTVGIPSGKGALTQKPFLSNTSMESYERSNCLGCHAKSTTTDTNFNTDFVYFLKLEVGNTCN